jgi:hypothetical protein
MSMGIWCLLISLGSLMGGAAADVPDQVDWPSFLSRHDPIWTAGVEQICTNVSSFDSIPQRIVKTGNCGVATCSSSATCVAEASAQCSSKAECVSFGVSPAWREGTTAQLYTKNNTYAEDNKDWTLYVEDPSKPKHLHCYNTTKYFTAWQDGPFFGNGLVGGLFRFENSSSLRMDVGRTDVWDRRKPGTPGYINGAGNLYMRPRLPVGHFLITAPPNCSWVFRTELLAAEIVVNISCAVGGPTTQLKVFAPSEANERSGIVLEVVHSASAAPLLPKEAFTFVAEESKTTRHGAPKGYEPNPPAQRKVCAGFESGEGVHGLSTCTVSTQTLLAGGDYAVAWGWSGAPDNSSSSARSEVLYIAIVADMPHSTSAATATSSVRSMASSSIDTLRLVHRQWWAAWYPKSFLSIGQSSSSKTDAKGALLSTALEAFYWIQMYKMASATREEGPALDLMGPWFQPSSWLYYWFDLNEQLQYW